MSFLSNYYGNKVRNPFVEYTFTSCVRDAGLPECVIYYFLADTIRTPVVNVWLTHYNKSMWPEPTDRERSMLIRSYFDFSDLEMFDLVNMMSGRWTNVQKDRYIPDAATYNEVMLEIMSRIKITPSYYGSQFIYSIDRCIGFDYVQEWEETLTFWKTVCPKNPEYDYPVESEGMMKILNGGKFFSLQNFVASTQEPIDLSMHGVEFRQQEGENWMFFLYRVKETLSQEHMIEFILPEVGSDKELKYVLAPYVPCQSMFQIRQIDGVYWVLVSSPRHVNAKFMLKYSAGRLLVNRSYPIGPEFKQARTPTDHDDITILQNFYNIPENRDLEFFAAWKVNWFRFHEGEKEEKERKRLRKMPTKQADLDNFLQQIVVKRNLGLRAPNVISYNQLLEILACARGFDQDVQGLLFKYIWHLYSASSSHENRAEPAKSTHGRGRTNQVDKISMSLAGIMSDKGAWEKSKNLTFATGVKVPIMFMAQSPSGFYPVFESYDNLGAALTIFVPLMDKGLSIHVSEGLPSLCRRGVGGVRRIVGHAPSTCLSSNYPFGLSMISSTVFRIDANTIRVGRHGPLIWVTIFGDDFVLTRPIWISNKGGTKYLASNVLNTQTDLARCDDQGIIGLHLEINGHYRWQVSLDELRHLKWSSPDMYGMSEEHMMSAWHGISYRHQNLGVIRATSNLFPKKYTSQVISSIDDLD